MMGSSNNDNDNDNDDNGRDDNNAGDVDYSHDYFSLYGPILHDQQDELVLQGYEEDDNNHQQQPQEPQEQQEQFDNGNNHDANSNNNNNNNNNNTPIIPYSNPRSLITVPLSNGVTSNGDFVPSLSTRRQVSCFGGNYNNDDNAITDGLSSSSISISDLKNGYEEEQTEDGDFDVYDEDEDEDDDDIQQQESKILLDASCASAPAAVVDTDGGVSCTNKRTKASDVPDGPDVIMNVEEFKVCRGKARGVPTSSIGKQAAETRWKRKIGPYKIYTKKQNITWENMFQLLLKYKNKNGNTVVSRGQHSENAQLGRWVSKQRCNKDVMSDDRYQKLNSIDFVWVLHEIAYTWDMMYKRLILYKEQHNGSTMVFYQDDPTLGLWVARHRRIGTKKYHKKLLDDIGFHWNNT
jgi:hypothetical protein